MDHTRVTWKLMEGDKLWGVLWPAGSIRIVGTDLHLNHAVEEEEEEALFVKTEKDQKRGFLRSNLFDSV